MESGKFYHGIWSYNIEDISKYDGVFGFLEYQKVESNLKIVGSLKGDQLQQLKNLMSNNSEVTYEPIIYGLVEQQLKVTIYKAISSGVITSSGLNQETYITKYVFFGGWINDFNDLGYSKVHVSIPVLGKRFEKSLIVDPLDASSIKVSKSPSDIYLGSIDGVLISFIDNFFPLVDSEIYESMGIRDIHHKKNYISFQERSYLRFDLSNKQHYTFDELIELVEKVIRFFGFIMDKELSYENLKFLNLEKNITLEGKDVNRKKTGKETYLFLYSQVDNIEDILNSWIQNYNTLTHIVDLYFFIRYGKNLIIENAFLNYVQCLEGIYYSIFSPPYNSEDYSNLEKEFKQIKKSLENDYPVLSNSRLIPNDILLTDKLEKIGHYINYHWVASDRDLIASYRNTISHGVGGTRRDNLDKNKQQVYNLILTMKFVIEMFIIKSLGVPDPLFNSIFLYKEKILNREKQ